jgi:hypothetical protein
LKLREDLPLKYYFSNILLDPKFKTEDSVFFIILQYLIKNTKPPYKFSKKTLKYIFGEDLLTNEEHKLFIVDSLKKLISLGIVEVNNDTFTLNKKHVLTFYTEI